MEEPLVSVIIPTYDREDELLRAIRSVEEQTYPNVEIVVVDDNPDRDLSELVPDGNYLKLVSHESNRGVAGARNSGIKVSNGRYIAFLDDDDTWFEEKLRKQVNVLNETNDDIGMAYSGTKAMKGGKQQYVYVPDKQGDVFYQLLVGNFIPSPTPVVKRECFLDVGVFDESLTSLDDYDMWLRIAKDYMIECLEEPLAVTYQGHARMSDSTKNIFQAEKEILNKYQEEYKRHPSAFSERCLKLGILAERLDDNKEAISWYTKAIRDGKPTISVVLRMIFLFLPDVIANSFSKVHDKVLQSGGPS